MTVMVSQLNAPFVPSGNYPADTIWTWAEFLALPSDSHVREYEKYALACHRAQMARDALRSAEEQVVKARAEWEQKIAERLSARFDTGRNWGGK